MKCRDSPTVWAALLLACCFFIVDEFLKGIFMFLAEIKVLKTDLIREQEGRAMSFS